MLKKLTKILLVFAMMLQLVATPLIATASDESNEEIEQEELDQAEMDDVYFFGVEEETESFEDDFSALMKFSEWTDDERDQFWNLWPGDLRETLDILRIRAEVAINEVGEELTLDLLQQLVNSHQRNFMIPHDDLYFSAWAEAISFVDAYAQLNDLIEFGWNLVEELESALDGILIFPKWTDGERDEFWGLWPNDLRVILDALRVRAEVVINEVGEGPTVDLLQQLANFHQRNFMIPHDDLYFSAWAEAISFADAYTQLNNLVELGWNLVEEFESALDGTLTFPEWTDDERNQFWDLWPGDLRETLDILRIRAKIVISDVEEGPTVDLLQQLMNTHHHHFMIPHDQLYFSAWAEAISFADAYAQLNALVKLGSDLADELQNTIWSHHGGQLEASYSIAESWYLQAAELYEAISSTGAEEANQSALSDMIAEYYTIVLAMEVVTEVEAGRLIPRSGVNFEDVLDGTNEVVEQFDDLSLRLEVLINSLNGGVVRNHSVRFASGANGNLIMPHSNLTVAQGRSLGSARIPTPNPSSNFEFVHWTSNRHRGTFTTAQLRRLVITENTTFTAVFRRISRTLTVAGGAGGGTIGQGSSRSIRANAPRTGYRFDRWATTTRGVRFSNARSATTTITMPSRNATVRAVFVPRVAANPASNIRRSGTIRNANVPLRRGPGGAYHLNRRLRRGQQITVLNNGRNGWRFVQVGTSGVRGWVRSNQIAEITTAGIVIGNRVPMRTSANSGTTLARLNRNTTITILGVNANGRWTQVRVGRQTGWVQTSGIRTTPFARTRRQVQLRRGPSHSFSRPVNSRVNQNVRVIVLARQGNWSRIRVGNRIGWVPTNQLR